MALDPGFNAAVLQIATRLFPCGFDVSFNPPTYNQLVPQLDAGQRMVVSAEVTDSVFGDDEVLYAYRAWLLWCYWKQDGDSSSTDDATIWQMQCGHIETLYGKSDQTRRWSKLLWQEKLAYIADQIAA